MTGIVCRAPDRRSPYVRASIEGKGDVAEAAATSLLPPRPDALGLRAKQQFQE
jgi:hypothetical protein